MQRQIYQQKSEELFHGIRRVKKYSALALDACFWLQDVSHFAPNPGLMNES